MYNFEFKQPKTISEALNALKSDEAEALAGGQTLIPTMKQRLASPATLVSPVSYTHLTLPTKA